MTGTTVQQGAGGGTGEPALPPALLPAASTRGRPRPNPAPPLPFSQWPQWPQWPQRPDTVDTVTATHRGGSQALSAHLIQSGVPGGTFTAVVCIQHTCNMYTCKLQSESLCS